MPSPFITRRWGTELLKLAGFSLIVTAAAFAIMMRALRAALPWHAIGLNLAIFFLYAFFIGGLCWLVMPRLGERTEDQPWALRWMILLAGMSGLSVAGTFLASVVTHFAFGSLRPVPVPALFTDALRTALPITIVVGVITTIIEAGKGRLQASQAELQQQRLERERAEKLAAEASLASLSSRVHPHFLFNTLNSIAALIRENPGEAERTVERLASLLRSSLENPETVPLEQEIKLVRDYLEIQKTRMGERLKFQVAMESGIRAAVPPFSVQTLAENSLKHVGEQRHQGVDLQIRATRKDGGAVVLVTDNGSGFDSASMRAGRGLDNLQARLRAVYGERAGVEFLREPEHMTVLIHVPAQDESLSTR